MNETTYLDRAIESYREALKLAEQQADSARLPEMMSNLAYALKAQSYETTDRGLMAEAVAILERARDLTPADANPQFRKMLMERLEEFRESGRYMGLKFD